MRVKPIGFAIGLAAVTLLGAVSGAARANQITAVYDAYWAGLPAGKIRLQLDDSAGSYYDRIEISSTGLPRLVTHFRGIAQAEGRLAAGQPANPTRYDAYYDLRKRRDSRISMHFVGRSGATLANRGPQDTSRKAPLAEQFRRDAVDPMTAIERLREAVRAGEPGHRFSIPVYDGARRFDVIGEVLSGAGASGGPLLVALTLRPIAGFKGESSDDGDPDDAPRPVMVALSNDQRRLPLSLSVRMFYLPLSVRLDRVCSRSTPCRDVAPALAGRLPAASSPAVPAVPLGAGQR
ncbi:MAG: DUF3108 domain-containing protein [Stellaceae bacterium]